MTDLAKIDAHEQPAVTSESAALISMIERAARDPNVDIDKMERLFQMHERMVATHAKTTYLSAFAELQAEMPAAIRRGKGHNAVAYARYEDLIETLRPHLTKHGFSISHRVDTKDGRITVTGILGHKGGHSESTTMTLPPDDSGKKNPVHAMASSISYGKRYVTLTLTGIATEGEDDDAKAATAHEPISDEQHDELMSLINETKTNIDAFLKLGNVESLSDIPANQFQAAKARLLAKKAQMMRDAKS